MRYSTNFAFHSRNNFFSKKNNDVNLSSRMYGAVLIDAIMMVLMAINARVYGGDLINAILGNLRYYCD